MKYKNGYIKTWSILLGITATLFFVVAVSLLAFNYKYLRGAQYLATSILFFSSLLLMVWKGADVKNKTLFNIGYIFAVIGLVSTMSATMLGVWAAGATFFIVGFVGKTK